jgi:hypothetical protein
VWRIIRLWEPRCELQCRSRRPRGAAILGRSLPEFQVLRPDVQQAFPDLEPDVAGLGIGVHGFVVPLEDGYPLGGKPRPPPSHPWGDASPALTFR